MRRWLEGGAIVAVALATIATSKPSWHLDAKLPPIDSTKGVKLVVEASSPPYLAVDVDAKRTDLAGGKYEYFVPPGHPISAITISEKCHGGSLCTSSDCTIPTDAFVRVVSVTSVETWKLEVESAEQTTMIDPAKPDVNWKVIVAASQRPRIDIIVTSGAIAPHSWPDGDTEFTVWFDRRTVTTPTTVTWKAKLSIDGPCDDAANCKVPADAKLSIFDVRPQAKPVTP